MTIAEVISKIEQRIPLQQAEDFDNVGLLCGVSTRNVSGILVCHDALENVYERLRRHTGSAGFMPKAGIMPGPCPPTRGSKPILTAPNRSGHAGMKVSPRRQAER